MEYDSRWRTIREQYIRDTRAYVLGNKMQCISFVLNIDVSHRRTSLQRTSIRVENVGTYVT